MIACYVKYLLLLCLIHAGNSLRCYECSSRLGPGEYDACTSGNWWYLRKVECMGPSVCAAYMYTTSAEGLPPMTSMTRGCQGLRYGATCEDIFNDLRMTGGVLPGHHTCATCSTDLCNDAKKISVSGIFILGAVFTISMLIC